MALKNILFRFLIEFFARKLGTNMVFSGCDVLPESSPASIVAATPEENSDGTKTIATSCRSSINSQGASNEGEMPLAP